MGATFGRVPGREALEVYMRGPLADRGRHQRTPRTGRATPDRRIPCENREMSGSTPSWSGSAAGLQPGSMPAAIARSAIYLPHLEGRFVPAGPSGAPSRGRLEVLPTGRNFYSVDVRSIPTVTAWRLGFKSASLLIERHLQEHGTWPGTIGISVWGTATMRTGGDDIAQAFALLGVRPVWAPGSNRVTDFRDHARRGPRAAPYRRDVACFGFLPRRFQ